MRLNRSLSHEPAQSTGRENPHRSRNFMDYPSGKHEVIGDARKGSDPQNQMKVRGKKVPRQRGLFPSGPGELRLNTPLKTTGNREKNSTRPEQRTMIGCPHPHDSARSRRTNAGRSEQSLIESTFDRYSGEGSSESMVSNQSERFSPILIRETRN